MLGRPQQFLTVAPFEVNPFQEKHIGGALLNVSMSNWVETRKSSSIWRYSSQFDRHFAEGRATLDLAIW